MIFNIFSLITLLLVRGTPCNTYRCRIISSKNSKYFSYYLWSRIGVKVTLFELCLENKNITGIAMYVSSFNGGPAVSYKCPLMMISLTVWMNKMSVTAFYIQVKGQNCSVSIKRLTMRLFSGQVRLTRLWQTIRQRWTCMPLEYTICIRMEALVANAAVTTVINWTI